MQATSWRERLRFRFEKLESPYAPALSWALGIALAARLLLGLFMGAAWWTLETYLPLNAVPASEYYGGLHVPDTVLWRSVLGVWVRWDAVHHLNLAFSGYAHLSAAESVYYPLYAGLTWVVAQLLGGHFVAAGLLVSLAATIATLTFVYLLAELWFGAGAGRWAAASLVVYPTAVFLFAPFTESLFLALAAGSFWFAYRRRWFVTGVLAALASLTRGPGLALSAAFVLILWQSEGSPRSNWRAYLSPGPLFAMATPLAGGGAFLAWRALMGYPPMAEVLRNASGLEFVDPMTGLVSALGQWFRVHDLPTTLDVLSVLLFLAVTVAMIARPRWRRPEAIVYMALNLLLFMSKRSLVASSLQSSSRYVLSLFPAFLVAGDWLNRTSPGKRFAYLSASGSLLIVLSILFAFWVFIG